jgi:hypothetical protein
MLLKSDLEWDEEYEKHSFSFKEWPKFLMFFRLSGDSLVTVPTRVVGDKGTEMRDQKIRLADLPKHKAGLNSIKLSVQTQNKLVKFDTVGASFKALAK